MDPTATVELIYDQIRDRDFENATISIRDLERWLRRDGLIPQFGAMSKEDWLTWCRVTKRYCRHKDEEMSK